LRKFISEHGKASLRGRARRAANKDNISYPLRRPRLTGRAADSQKETDN